MAAATAYVSLGSNLSNREGILVSAVKAMDDIDGVCVLRVSQFIETDPMGGPSGQGKYLNGVAEIETTLSPIDLLNQLQRVERALGRDRAAEQRWGPRTCDLDILLVGRTVIQTSELTVPHPRMHERKFVLEPLAQIAPVAVHPVLNKTARQMLAELEQQL